MARIISSSGSRPLTAPGQVVARLGLGERLQAERGNDALQVGPGVAVERVTPGDDQRQVGRQVAVATLQQGAQPAVEGNRGALVGVEE